MGNKKSTKSLHTQILSITLIPVFFMTLLIIVLGVRSFTKVLENEIKHGLMDLSSTIITMYDKLYPGDFEVITRDNELFMIKGDHLMNGDFSIIDSIKEDTGADVTLFFQDIRLITTLTDQEGERLVGSTVSAVVKRDVLDTGSAVFYPSVDINGDNYFAYYSPLQNEDGTIMGMIFVAKPVAAVREKIKNAALPIVLYGIVSIIVIGLLLVRFSNALMLAIKKMEDFLSKVAKGNLNESLDYQVMKREDEIGELGRYAIKMQKSLRDLVEKDALTGLINRRSADKKLLQLQKDKENLGTGFCLAIGDIDFFKKVNDTYGHEWGDVVLVKVSELLKNHFVGKGFVARWGGEEFLLVFTNQTIEEAKKVLEDTLQSIRDMEIPYQDDSVIKVTMSFGVCEGEGDDLDAIIREADHRLYYSKNHGRNQITG